MGVWAARGEVGGEAVPWASCFAHAFRSLSRTPLTAWEIHKKHPSEEPAQ